MDTKAHIVVEGLVQGVGFRWFALRKAEQLGLPGWVSNLPNGRVEVVASGNTAALDRMETALSIGPSTARVDRVEKADYPHEVADDKPFSVR